MKYLAIAAVMFLGACGGSGGPAGDGVTGAAGTTGTAGTGSAAGTGAAAGTSGAAGTGADECTAFPRCTLATGQNGFIVGASHKEYSSPTCPGRICVPCGASKTAGGSTSVNGCSIDSADGQRTVYCDDSVAVISGHDCN